MKLALTALLARHLKTRRSHYHAYCSPDMPQGIKPRMGAECGCKPGHIGPVIGIMGLLQ